MLAVEESRSIRKLVQGGCKSCYYFFLIYGHTNDNVVCEIEWLHIPSKIKVCQVYHSPFQSDACLELDFHVNTANDFA